MLDRIPLRREGSGWRGSQERGASAFILGRTISYSNSNADPPAVLATPLVSDCRGRSSFCPQLAVVRGKGVSLQVSMAKRRPRPQSDTSSSAYSVAPLEFEVEEGLEPVSVSWTRRAKDKVKQVSSG